MQVLIIVGGKKDPQLQTFSVKDPWGHDTYNYKSPLIRQTEDYISSHLTERLTLATVAANVYVSPWYLDKQIAQETGNGFCWMVTSARVEVAKNLLKQQDLKIGEIACKVGFSDPAHFARTFKKVTGMTAKEWRRLQ